MAFYTGRKTLYEYIIQDIPDGYHTFQTVSNGELVNIDVEFYNFYDDVYYEEDPVLGDSIPDQRMLILKYYKNLTIGHNVLFTPQTRKKGMLIFCMGELVNYGIISMTARGAIAEGQNVYLWENEDGTFEFVPAYGGGGGESRRSNSGGGNVINGNNGINGINRRTGGGGSGGVSRSGTYGIVVSGAGQQGTSYSGGSGGGGIYGGSPNIANSTNVYSAESGFPNGGKGGNGFGSASGGGAGNPSGNYGIKTGKEEGTGGLLIIFCEKRFINQHNGRIYSNGSKGTDATNAGGGGSGGGSINIFTHLGFENYGTVEAKGGEGGKYTATSGYLANGGAGGDGTITIMQYDIEKDRIFLLDDKYFRVDHIDMGNVIEGSYSPIKKFFLENMYNTDLTKLELWCEPNENTPQGAYLQLSKSKNPFVPEDVLVYNQIIPYRGRVEFYTRIILEDGVRQAGQFDLKVKVESRSE